MPDVEPMAGDACMLKSFNDYLTANHSRLLSLWHIVVTFRREFSQLKTTTDDELAALHAEFGRVSLSMNSACLAVRSQLHTAQLTHQVLILRSPFIHRRLSIALLVCSMQHWIDCLTGSIPVKDDIAAEN